MRFPSAIRRDPSVDAWFAPPSSISDAPHLVVPGQALRAASQEWFEQMRACGPDVQELLHDGCPTACVKDVAFGYVNAFKAHVNVGFFQGASLIDPAGLLEGTGKRMRHVKLFSGRAANADALGKLISAAYHDIRSRLGTLS